MLLILTGDVQIGKTRWLQRSVAQLEDAGVPCHGVIAPGTWIDNGDGTFEKTGIDNLLLPTHEVVPFARRADLAQQDGQFDEQSQAGRAKLKWHISDSAIARVNEHFRTLAAATSASEPKKGVLFVDELGQLELLRGEGLTDAMDMLSKGPQSRYAHAIVVARDLFGLPERAAELFANAWGGSERISPTDEAWQTWLAPLTH